MCRLIIFLALMLAVSTTDLLAGSPGGDRWTIGLDALVSYIEAEDADEITSPDAVSVDKIGGGGAFHLSYALAPTFRLRLHLGGADHGSTNPHLDFGLSRVGIEGVLVFRPEQGIRPYVSGGFSSLNTKGKHGAYSYQGNGAGVVLGTGLYYRVSQRFDLHFSVRAEMVFLQENEATITQPDGSTESTDAPFDTWLFSGKIAGQVGIGMAVRL